MKDWFVTEAATSGHDALVALTSHHYDILVLDLGLPDIHGSEVCRKVREVNPEIPIMVLSGIESAKSKINLIEIGADDYMTKPFDTEELRARLYALLRRRSRLPAAHTLSFADLVISPASRTVTRAGQPLRLRRKEFDILEYLAINQGRVVTREMIVNHAWPSTSSSWTGSVDVHIKHIRDKVDKPFPVKLVHTIYSVGYMLELPENVQKYSTSHKTKETA